MDYRFASLFSGHHKTRSALRYRQPLGWAFFLGLALLCAVLALFLIFRTVPALTVDINLSRQQALAAAEAFQRNHFPDLSTERSAVLFESNQDLQYYIELEGGDEPGRGRADYQALIPQSAAATHHWTVRLFTPGEEEELRVLFAPGGDLLGYTFVLPDSALPEPPASAALDVAAARLNAEREAQRLIGARFADYLPLEASERRHSNGRVDHHFTYEHSRLQAGEARFRLVLQLAGDQLVTLQPVHHIPESFSQRFASIRAVNTQIAQTANFALLMMALVGVLVGGLWLYRRHQLRWRLAFLPALVIGLGLGANMLSSLPVSWMTYQSADSASNFLLTQTALAGVVALAATLIFATLFAVAEGLSRLAFPEQPRLWPSFRTEVLSSQELSGRLLGGYAWTGFFLLYAILFYLFSQQVLGWWQPAGMESDPNILASWRPALSPIFNALQAGAWEESLFRAIPLSAAVLLARRYGWGWRLVLPALLLQALIFAGAHANYPNLPGYSRLVELLIPALVFGLVFLRFGLFICVLMHFEYDLVLMSLPLFTASDSGLWLDRLLVIMAGALPLLLLIHARLRAGKLQPLAEQWLNGANMPVSTLPSLTTAKHLPPSDASSDSSSVPPALPSTTPLADSGSRSLSGKAMYLPRWAMALIALVWMALMLIMVPTSPSPEWPELELDRSEAQARAQEVLIDHGVELLGEWRNTTVLSGADTQALDYVWRQSDTNTTQSLLGNFIATPGWISRWKRFDGPMEERTEEWSVRIGPDGSVVAFTHRIPEGRAGESLDREAALARVDTQLQTLGWGQLDQLELVSVEETEQPARRDWAIHLADRSQYNTGEGFASIHLRVAGSEVNHYSRGIHRADSWLRQQQQENAQRQPYRLAAMLAQLIIVGCALATFFRRHDGRRFSIRAALPWMLIALLPFTLSLLMQAPQQLEALEPTMSWWPQIAFLLMGLTVVIAGLGAVVFLAAQVVHREHPTPGSHLHQDMLTGFFLSLGMAAYAMALRLLLPDGNPAQPILAEAGSLLPWLSAAFNGAVSLGTDIIVLAVCIGLLRFIQRPWRLWLIASLVLSQWLANALASPEPALRLFYLLQTLIPQLLVVFFILRRQLGTAIALLGCNMALQHIISMRALYSAAHWHGMLGLIITMMATVWLVWHWYRIAEE